MAKAIISSTYDNRYLYFLPIVTWCWNKLGVDVVCFMPYSRDPMNCPNGDLVLKTIHDNNLKCDFKWFWSKEYKEATYAQCARLYAACLDLPEDEILIISDCDMGNFKIPPYENGITIFGSDLVPEGQFPMCYASGTIKQWRSAFNLNMGYNSAVVNNDFSIMVKPYQQCLDELLGNIECDNMRGNYWGKDQQTLWENTKDIATLIPRARPGTQFADNRVDRDDINWRAYVNEDLIDAHLWRPGYTDENFANIMELLTMKYPNDDFTWLVEYNSEYKKLLL
jgi:hypothetical protein